MNEFQKIPDRRRQFDTSPLFPLAHLGLARAAAIAGDTTNSRRAYQDLRSGKTPMRMFQF
jgi:hypothetical protein